MFSGRRRLLGVPWSSERPLVMEPDASVGHALDIRGLEEMQDRHWEDLLQIAYPVAVSQNPQPKSLLLCVILTPCRCSCGPWGGGAQSTSNLTG